MRLSPFQAVPRNLNREVVRGGEEVDTKNESGWGVKFRGSDEDLEIIGYGDCERTSESPILRNPPAAVIHGCSGC